MQSLHHLVRGIMIILRLEKQYFDETSKKIEALETEENLHSYLHPKLNQALRKVLDYSADIIEDINARFSSASTLFGNREDATLGLEIDNEKYPDYGSKEEVMKFLKTNSRIKKKLVSISTSFSTLSDLTPTDVGIPYHSTEDPMIDISCK